jgi:hypothetical protein
MVCSVQQARVVVCGKQYSLMYAVSSCEACGTAQLVGLPWLLCVWPLGGSPGPLINQA